MRRTYHLVPAATWTASDPDGPYVAASLATEGFTHCTDGIDALIATANRHYRHDPRPFLALTIDLDAVRARWTVEDAAKIYPHVFGPIERAAILDVAPLARSEDGEFTAPGRMGPMEQAQGATLILPD